MYGRDECLGQEGGEKHGGKGGGGAVKTQSSYGRIEFTDGWMRYAYPPIKSHIVVASSLTLFTGFLHHSPQKGGHRHSGFESSQSGDRKILEKLTRAPRSVSG